MLITNRPAEPGEARFQRARSALSLNLLAIVASTLLIALVAGGPFSQENRQAITWGQDLDIRAMAVAISRLEYGLGGGVYYRPVEATLTEHMAGGPSVATDESQRRSKDPAYVNAALKAATALPKSAVPKGSVRDGTYGYFGEDLGTADLYALTFRFFGYDFSAIRAFYVAFLATSAGLFVLGFWRNRAALSALILTLGALYGLTTAAVFDDLMPSIAAHRGLSTLALIPFAHIVCAIRAPERLRPWQVVLVAAQAALLVFVTSFRSSASWTLIAIGVVAIASFRYGPLHYTLDDIVWLLTTRQNAFKGKLKRLQIRQPLIMLFLVLGVVLTGRSLERLTLDPVYFTDWSAGARHMVWHNAYIALTFHPDWPKVKPYAAQADSIHDSVTAVVYDQVARADCDCGPVGPENKYYAQGDVKVGVWERVAREAYIDFAWKHPLYMLELFAIYKPLLYLQTVVVDSLSRVHGAVWLILLGVATLAALLARSTPVAGRQTAAVVVLALIGAHLTVFWAYGAKYVSADPVWSVLLFGRFCVSRVLLLLINKAQQARLRQEV